MRPVPRDHLALTVAAPTKERGIYCQRQRRKKSAKRLALGKKGTACPWGEKELDVSRKRNPNRERVRI